MADKEVTDRSIEDVLKIMDFAKVDEKDVKSTVQCLSFVTELDNDHFKLMEVDNNVLQHLSQGDRLTVRGLKSDQAVVCTDTETYLMREQETSNSLLVVQNLSLSNDLPPSDPDTGISLKHTEVCALKYHYFEIQSIQPKLLRIKELLEKNMYNGEECEKDEDHMEKKYTYSDLLDEVQASEAQIHNGLKKLEACQIDGYQRLLTFDFHSSVVTHIINLVDEQSWSMDALPVKECCDTLQELFRRDVISHVLLRLCDDDQTHKDTDHEDPEARWKLSEDKVCRFFAELILRPVVGFKLSEFEQTWQLSVLEGMTTSLTQLEGLALIDRDSIPPSIRYFNVADLPEGIEDRLNKLFMTKEKWTMDEISPYIQELATQKLSAGALLTKYARASTVNGIKMFNSKRPLR